MTQHTLLHFRTILFLMFITTSVSQGQSGNIVKSLNAFKYAAVYKPSSLIESSLELHSYLEYQLSNQGFHIAKLQDSLNATELIRNPCLGSIWSLMWSTNVASSTGEMKLTAFDCNNQIIFSNSVTFRLKYDPLTTMHNAINKCLKPLTSLNYKFNESLSNELYKPKVEFTPETEESLRQYFDDTQLDPIEGIFKSVDRGYSYKIGIKKRGNIYVAIIIDTNAPYWKIGELKAYFEKTSISSVFPCTYLNSVRQKLECFAELDDIILKIKILETNQNKTIIEFLKLYPNKIK